MKELKEKGFFDIVGFLFNDLKQYLIDEGRFHKKVEGYCSVMFDNIYSDNVKDLTNEEEMFVYGQILNSIKKRIFLDFERLQERGLGKADCVILLMKKILDCISEDKEFCFIKETNNIKEVIYKLFDNIRNKAKFDGLREFSYEINKILSQDYQIRGKSIDVFSLEKPKIVNEPKKLNNNKLPIERETKKLTTILL